MKGTLAAIPLMCGKALLRPMLLLVQPFLKQPKLIQKQQSKEAFFYLFLFFYGVLLSLAKPYIPYLAL